MAFNRENLALLGYANGHGLYIYANDTDDFATVYTDGYFNNTDDNLNLQMGDQITVVGSTGTYTLFVHTIAAGGAVQTFQGGQSHWLTVHFEDITIAASRFVMSTTRGLVNRICMVIDEPLNADATMTFKNGANTIATLVLTAAGSAAGQSFEAQASGVTAVDFGSVLEIDGDGNPSIAAGAMVAIEVIPAC